MPKKKGKLSDSEEGEYNMIPWAYNLRKYMVIIPKDAIGVTVEETNSMESEAIDQVPTVYEVW